MKNVASLEGICPSSSSISQWLLGKLLCNCWWIDFYDTCLVAMRHFSCLSSYLSLAISLSFWMSPFWLAVRMAEAAFFLLASGYYYWIDSASGIGCRLQTTSTEMLRALSTRVLEDSVRACSLRNAHWSHSAVIACLHTDSRKPIYHRFEFWICPHCCLYYLQNKGYRIPL